jgi:hypothetical protein
MEGVHKVEDYVRQHFDNVIFESCAGGGQRIDLATIQRRHTYWVSDQTMDPLLVKFHLEGLNLFVPGNGQMWPSHRPPARIKNRASPSRILLTTSTLAELSAWRGGCPNGRRP